jgi:hypothetical protein
MGLVMETGVKLRMTGRTGDIGGFKLRANLGRKVNSFWERKPRTTGRTCELHDITLPFRNSEEEIG